MKYKGLSAEVQNKIMQDKNVRLYNDCEIRRNKLHDVANLWRPAYIRDSEKIMNCPYYNRYTDKTQVFSLYKNDDITRRALHVQFVSRIARNIGRLLGLNLDLIEAIALGHDIGHTPFGHAGEKYLNKMYYQNTGRIFLHNVHSVRVLDKIFNYNISLQTLDGILSHNGEIELKEYVPQQILNFEEFDKKVENCYTSREYANKILPSSLEACVVRISDLIAYLGKDRQDAEKAGVMNSSDFKVDETIGSFNSVMINNLIVNIIENSYGKDKIILSDEYFDALKQAKADNYKLIYLSEQVAKPQQELFANMFEKLYVKLLDDVFTNNKKSPVFKHHIDFVNGWRKYYKGDDYANTEPNQIVVDYIASMTDDYFIDLYQLMFPDDIYIEYKSYFNEV